MCDPDAWLDWLADFRERFIKAKGWTEKDAKRRIRNAWVVVREGRVHTLTSDAPRPADTVPVFEILTLSGWKRPIEITDRLTGLIAKAMTSQRAPRDIVLGLLNYVEHADGPNESAETRQKRDKAAFWIWQLLDACEDKTLAGVIGSDVFWQAILSALEAGHWLAILDFHCNPQALADLIKAQAFQSGRSPDELTRRLEAEWLRQRQDIGREPKPRAVAKGIGGAWNALDGWWEFPFDDLLTPTHKALCRRIETIKKTHKRAN